MTEEKEFLEWLQDQDGYSVRAKTVEEKFDIEFDLGGVTVTMNEDGETMVPKRDYRQAIKYGRVLD